MSTYSKADLEAMLEGTPGPWRVDAYSEGLDVRGEHAVARIAGQMTMGYDADPDVKARAIADACLIAAAPTLAQEVLDNRAEIERLRRALNEAQWWLDAENEPRIERGWEEATHVIADALSPERAEPEEDGGAG